LPLNETLSLQLKIDKHNNSNAFSHAYYAQVKASNTKKMVGKIWVYQKRDSTTPPLKAGTLVLARGILKEIAPPKNPGAFDFKQFLAHQKIGHQFSIQAVVILNQHMGESIIMKTLSTLKQFVQQQLLQSGLQPHSQKMIQTLLMGERNVIEKSLKEAYAEAGVIHLLAISGLHVGILTFFFAFVLNPLKKWRWGRFLRGVTLLLLLWGFALFSGASASVVRAAAMFSALVVAQAMGRHQNSFHFLVLSFILLLGLYPPYLHQVGFQMSYAAVFGILWIYPRLKNIYYPHTFHFRKIADALYVCLAAQLMVTPLSIYYFHQFPGLFLLSNLVIVPLFGMFLVGMLGTLLLCLFFSLPSWWIVVVDGLVQQLNGFVVFIAKQDQFLFKEISLDLVEMLLWYALLVAALMFFYSKKSSFVIVLFSRFLLLQSYGLYNDFITQKENYFWVFHKNQQVVYAFQKGQTAFIYSENEDEQPMPLLSDFIRTQNILYSKPLPKQNLYAFKKSLLLCIGKETTLVPLPQKPTHLLLTHNTKIHLERWLKNYTPQWVIADGSNATWQIARWKKTCEQLKVPFHSTLEKGALKINL